MKKLCDPCLGGFFLFVRAASKSTLIARARVTEVDRRTAQPVRPPASPVYCGEYIGGKKRKDEYLIWANVLTLWCWFLPDFSLAFSPHSQFTRLVWLKRPKQFHSLKGLKVKDYPGPCFPPHVKSDIRAAFRKSMRRALGGPVPIKGVPGKLHGTENIVAAPRRLLTLEENLHGYIYSNF